MNKTSRNKTIYLKKMYETCMKLVPCGKKLFSYEEKHLLEIKNSDIYFFFRWGKNWANKFRFFILFSKILDSFSRMKKHWGKNTFISKFIFLFFYFFLGQKLSRKKIISSQKFRFFFQGGNLKNKIRFSLFIDFLFMY